MTRRLFDRMSYPLRWLFAPALPVRWVLLASLAVNCFLVSVAAVHWVQGSRTDPDESDRVVARLLLKLPADDALLVQKALRGKRPLLRAARTSFDLAVKNATVVAQRDPFDAPAFAQALDVVRQKRSAMTDLRLDLYLQVAPRLSAQGRRQLAGTDR